MMIMGIMASNDSMVSMHWFPKGLREGPKEYLKVLRDFWSCDEAFLTPRSTTAGNRTRSMGTKPRFCWTSAKRTFWKSALLASVPLFWEAGHYQTLVSGVP